MAAAGLRILAFAWWRWATSPVTSEEYPAKVDLVLPGLIGSYGAATPLSAVKLGSCLGQCALVFVQVDTKKVLICRGSLHAQPYVPGAALRPGPPVTTRRRPSRSVGYHELLMGVRLKAMQFALDFIPPYGAITLGKIAQQPLNERFRPRGFVVGCDDALRIILKRPVRKTKLSAGPEAKIEIAARQHAILYRFVDCRGGCGRARLFWSHASFLSVLFPLPQHIESFSPVW